MPINYNPNLSKVAGVVELKDGDPVIDPRDRQTVLHLLFWLNYTKDGRDFLKSNRAGDVSDDQIRKNFEAKLLSGYNIGPGPLQTAFIEAHLAASKWVKANDKLPSGSDREAEKTRQEKIYQQHMSFICWTLWENTQDHEFSMNW